MMEKVIRICAAFMLPVFVYWTADAALALAFQAGSENDPVVSRSYLEERLRQIQDNDAFQVSDELLSFIVDEVVRQVLEVPIETPSTMYRAVSVNDGQIIIGQEGTEIVLRSGSGVVYTEVQNGLANITTGEEVFYGAEVGLNNMLIVPRGDGRGVRVTSPSWFIIKGEYTIK